jgi:glycosyltransferase involved in cell wall biosynthesis
MAADGAVVRVLSVEPGGEYRVERRAGIEVERVPGRDLTRVVPGPFMVGRGLARVARRAVELHRPHVMHATSLHLLSSLTAARIAAGTGVPLVLTAHLGATDALPVSTRLAARAYEATAGRRILQRSARVVAVSPDAERQVRSLGYAGPVDLAPNGVDADLFALAGPTARDAPPLVVFVGRLVANKGPDVFIDALAQVRARSIELRAAVIGDGPLRAALARRAARAGLEDIVTWTGTVEHAQVANWLSRATLTVRPSTTEGRALGILEAMAAGVCVIASDLAANRDVLSHDVDGLLVATGDVTAVADAIVALLADPARRARLAAAAQRRVAGATWEAATDATLASLRAAARVT